VPDQKNRSVAIVGSGPGGMYIAQALLLKAPGCRIDILDKLPTPFGLIRGGVAPDHQKTKRVDAKYAQSIAADGVRFIGNVTVGQDVAIEELSDTYDAVVLAFGAPYDNALGIPGEDKAGVIGSNAFVGWYNCHPEFRDLDPYLEVEGVVVIGIGNVAIDVARVLAKTPAEMAETDIADYAENRIKDSPVRDIWMFGRRGPVEAAFTNTELRELGALADCKTDVDPNQLPKEVPQTLEDRIRKVKSRILDTLWSLSDPPEGDKRRNMHIRFYARPVEVLGGARVEGVRMEHTRVEDGRTIGTGETFDVPCGLLVTCIGSRARAIEGTPFDEDRGVVAHTDGRVTKGVYAAGWVKRGAVGTIGTNKLDSDAVADLIVADFGGEPKPGPDGFDRLVREHGLDPVSFDDWLVIKRLEEAAASAGAPRRKFTTVKEMLEALSRERAGV
jgi:ferredoxin--NADP+ reductase